MPTCARTTPSHAWRSTSRPARPAKTNVERCDGLDNDCDGATDEGFGVGEACAAGTGACERAGVRACAEDGASAACAARPGDPVAEICNGLDDDCDGVVDNPAGASCQAAGDGGCGCELARRPRGSVLGLFAALLVVALRRRVMGSR